MPADPGSRRRSSRKRLNGASYEHPLAFWIGVATTSLGVALQLPDYFRASDMHYMMAGMPISPEMAVGMCLLFLGVGITTYSLFPRSSLERPELSGMSITPLDDAPIKRSHILL